MRGWRRVARTEADQSRACVLSWAQARLCPVSPLDWPLQSSPGAALLYSILSLLWLKKICSRAQWSISSEGKSISKNKCPCFRYYLLMQLLLTSCSETWPCWDCDIWTVWARFPCNVSEWGGGWSILGTVLSLCRASCRPTWAARRARRGRAGRVAPGQEGTELWRAEYRDNSSVTPHQRMQQHPHPWQVIQRWSHQRVQWQSPSGVKWPVLWQAPWHIKSLAEYWTGPEAEGLPTWWRVSYCVIFC